MNGVVDRGQLEPFCRRKCCCGPDACDIIKPLEASEFVLPSRPPVGGSHGAASRRHAALVHRCRRGTL